MSACVHNKSKQKKVIAIDEYFRLISIIFSTLFSWPKDVGLENSEVLGSKPPIDFTQPEHQYLMLEGNG